MLTQYCYFLEKIYDLASHNHDINCDWWYAKNTNILKSKKKIPNGCIFLVWENENVLGMDTGNGIIM